MSDNKILLIEDDKFTRELYEEVIRDAGYGIDTAVNGQEGLAKIHQGGWDLILLDVMMPKMDGIDVLRKLKDDPPKTSNGPVIILTNLTNDPVLNAAYGLNAIDFVVKSNITPGDLLSYIKKYLNNSKNPKSQEVIPQKAS
ncbi:hypothetical protein A2164_02690 [Candidatus Curtissbacteria bacterium RBG_13_35_7]|uniref:Response regulatory domain-containing protein n=1 Tax=Candidatus Curtissbacteria bacterium RBG_13_35_7 TaxID=1797705 RepID=A0A1F5G483_9BACT|nr:MAG: hypothetical protein A2164_02690 [Candidatus Curtissbacteria bacterium RBG_13_35_7]